MNEVSDIEAAIKNVLKGNLESYAEIVRTYESIVRAVIAAMISDQNIAQDLAQEVFVIAYRRLADYKPGTKFGAWLNTIARNVAQNERRRWYRKNDLNERYRAEIEKETENHLNSIAGSFRSEILETLRECVKKLEDRSRAIIEDFYFKGKTVKELAHGYNMSEGSVRVTMFRARQAVAECLRKKGAIS